MPETLTICPGCGENRFDAYIDSRDYFLTSQKFSIQVCLTCGLRVTNPRPTIEEIDKYYESNEYISHESAKKDLITMVYKCARFFSVRQKFAIIDRYIKGKYLLDIGCGTGELIHYCASKGYLVEGIEPNSKARNLAMSRYQLTVKAKLSDLTDNTHHYDCITLWHVLEHIHQINESIKNIRQLLNKNGIVIVAVPNSSSWDAYHYKNFWAAYDLPRHLYHFTENTLQTIFTKKGFNQIIRIPQKLDAYYISLLSEEYKTNKKNITKALINGFKSNMFAKRREFGYSSIILVFTSKIV